ncbi:phage minor head protein [Methylomicrobium sp. Wu6]|uniref:phage minor head protein n=1 Tax=Methylomicrobium sp. Wu6 TaxID=3107928 RepID=UPI002DD673F7|nr:phage minor head protein [Methylomicrobium sp. Wu6]MEC4747720.1 phage minor head protein [Methylomicrobium sp. Wu6]
MNDFERLIDEYEPKLENSFLSAVRDARENYPPDSERLNGVSDPNNLAINPLETQLSHGFKEDLGALHDEAIILLLSVLGLPNFHYPESLKIEFIDSQIREISAEVKKAVSLAGPNHKRIIESIGLTPNQARSLSAYRQALETVATKPIYASRFKINGTVKHEHMSALPPEVIRNLSASQRNVIRKSIERGLDPDAIDKLVAKQRKALLAHRANAIARNLASKVAHTAQQSAVNFAANTGLINANDYRRFWVTAHDERVRLAHNQTEAMNSKGVAINQPFQTPLGPVMNPPLEINCRCRAIIRKIKS